MAVASVDDCSVICDGEGPACVSFSYSGQYTRCILYTTGGTTIDVHLMASNSWMHYISHAACPATAPPTPAPTPAPAPTLAPSATLRRSSRIQWPTTTTARTLTMAARSGQFIAAQRCTSFTAHHAHCYSCSTEVAPRRPQIYFFNYDVRSVLMVLFHPRRAVADLFFTY